MGVRIEGRLGSDGYVLDFGDIKKAAHVVCKQLNEKTIIPTANDCLEVSSSDGQISLVCQDGSRFSLPQDDCVLLPIAHSSAEELAEYVCGELIKSLKIPGRRQVCSIEVTVAEAPGQEAEGLDALRHTARLEVAPGCEKLQFSFDPPLSTAGAQKAASNACEVALIWRSPGPALSLRGAPVWKFTG